MAGVDLPIVGRVELTPTLVLRALPFGWPTLLLDMFPAWGFLRDGAEVAIHLAPGLIEGESVSDAFMADYGYRLKIAAGFVGGAYISAATGALSVELSEALGSEEAERNTRKLDAFLKQAWQKLVEKLGPEQAQAGLDHVEQQFDQDFNGAFAKLVQNPDFQQALFDANPRGQGVPADAALRSAHLTPAEVAARFGIARQDVAALAINAVLRARVYDVSSQNFDPVTGAQKFPPEQESRASGTNSDWALVDLVLAQNNGQPPENVAVFQKQYDDAKAVDEGRATDPVVLYGQFLAAQVRGADPGYLRSIEDRFNKASGKASADAEARKAFGVTLPHVTGAGSLAKKILTIAVLTAPAWGPYVYSRWRHT